MSSISIASSGRLETKDTSAGRLSLPFCASLSHPLLSFSIAYPLSSPLLLSVLFRYLDSRLVFALNSNTLKLNHALIPEEPMSVPISLSVLLPPPPSLLTLPLPLDLSLPLLSVATTTATGI
jgi:hypothetical protein